MQVSTILFLRATILASVCFLFTLGSLTHATVIKRKTSTKTKNSQAVEIASRSDGTPNIPLQKLNLEHLPYVLPSGQNADGQFNTKTILSFIPYKQDALNFYKTSSTTLYNEMVTFVDYLDLLAKESPLYTQQLKSWQRKRQLMTLKPSKKVGVLSAAFDQNDLSFLDLVLGPSLAQTLKIDYQIKLPTPTTSVFPEELIKQFKTLWQAVRTTGSVSPKGKYSSTDMILIFDANIFLLYYSPMFHLSFVKSSLKASNALASSWEGISAKQLQRFFQVMHEYKILRLHELILSTLPNPSRKSVSSGTNIFNAPLPGTIFNMEFDPEKPTVNTRQLVTVNIVPQLTGEQITVPFLQSRQALLKEVQALSLLLKAHNKLNALGQSSKLYTAFEALANALNFKSSFLRPVTIQNTLNAIKADKNIIVNGVKQLLNSFTFVEQFYSFKTATSSLVQDLLKKESQSRQKIHGNIKFGIQWERLGADQVMLKYKNVLPLANFKNIRAPNKFAKEYAGLAKFFEKFDEYIIHWYIFDFQKTLSEQKKIQIIFSPRQSTRSQSHEITAATEPKSKRPSQKGKAEATEVIKKPPRKRNQEKQTQSQTPQRAGSVVKGTGVPPPKPNRRTPVSNTQRKSQSDLHLDQGIKLNEARQRPNIVRQNAMSQPSFSEDDLSMEMPVEDVRKKILQRRKSNPKSSMN